MPTNRCSLKKLKKNGFTKNIIPKKYRGIWYSYEKDYGQNNPDFFNTKIKKRTFMGNKVKVANKLIKIKGKYQLPVYDLNQQTITYLYISGKKNKKITMSTTTSYFENTNVIKRKSKTARHIIFIIPGYTNKFQAKSHPFSN